MSPDRITIGSIEFTNKIDYSKTDTVRDTYKYVANVYGIELTVYKWNIEDHVKFKFFDTTRVFSNKEISPELACKAALRMLLEAITQASEKLKEDLK